MKLRMLGGRYQPIMLSTEDVFSILEVNPQHWSANCAPIDGLSCDKDFLSYMDTDLNGKILPYEVCDALLWMREALCDHTGIWLEKDTLSLRGFHKDTPLGNALLASAEHVLETLGVSSETIALEQVQARTKILQAGAMNGDGVIPPSAILDPKTKDFLLDIISVMGGVQDRNGEQGVNEKMVLSFSLRAQAWLDWRGAEPVTSFKNPSTASMAISAAQPILDQYFSACLFERSTEEVHKAPLLTKPNTKGVLHKDAWVHPLYRSIWKGVLFLFSTRDELSWKDWESIWEQANRFLTWKKKEPEGNFSLVSHTRLTSMMEAEDIWNAVKEKIEEDRASARLLEKLSDLEKVLVFQKNLRSFLSSYVNFSFFYNPQRQSLPERGTLLMDGRLFRLSVQVRDREQHKARSKDSGFFLLYIQVHAPEGVFEVATAVTGKKRGDLHIGKRGVFMLVDGKDYPATVVDILDNPINIQEAFWAPFSSVQGFVQKRLEKFSSKHQQELEQTVESNLIQKEEAQEATSKAALLNGGVTIAALSSSFAYLIKTLSSIQLSQLFTVLLAPLLVVAMLSSVMAWWKLQRRDLGPVLEASGWGINHPLYAPSWATRVFTQGAVVASSLQHRDADLLIKYQQTVDPYGRSKSRVFLLFCLVLALLFWYGFEYFVQLYEWSSLYQPPVE